MADSRAKKFYWIKLEKDFFKRHDIRIIETMDNGKDYLLFYMKLLLESTSHEGYLRFSELIPYDDKMLSVVTNTNIDIVRSAIKLFQELKLMEVLDDRTIYMNELHKMLGAETGWAKNKREQRDTIKIELLENNTKGTLSQDVPLHASISNSNSLSQSLSLDLDFKEETLEDLFEDFWNNYPKKVAKADAKKWFTKNKKTITRDFVDKIVLAIQKQKSSDEWKKDKGQYIPHASTWLNQERWNDVLTYSQQKIMTALEEFMKDE